MLFSVGNECYFIKDNAATVSVAHKIADNIKISLLFFNSKRSKLFTKNKATDEIKIN